MHRCLDRRQSIDLSKSLPISASHLKDILHLDLLFFIDPQKINSYDNPHLGSDHADELEAFFETREPFATSVVADVKDNALFHSMREYWTSFVTTGRPVSSNGIAWEVRFSLSPFLKIPKIIFFLKTVSKPLKDANSGNPLLSLQPGNVSIEKRLSMQSQRCAFWHGSCLLNEMQT